MGKVLSRMSPKAKKIALSAIVLIVVVALFVVLNPTIWTNSHDTSDRKTAAMPVVRAFPLEIKDGRLVDGTNVLKVNQGDEVHINIVSDTADELHLHGYDKEVELTAEGPNELAFTADKSGRFEAELHHAEKTLFVLEVQPK